MHLYGGFHPFLPEVTIIFFIGLVFAAAQLNLNYAL